HRQTGLPPQRSRASESPPEHRRTFNGSVDGGTRDSRWRFLRSGPRPGWRPSTSRDNVLFAGGLCPTPPVRVGRGFHPVAGDRQDSHVCRGPGRSPQRRDPARTHRPGGGTSWLSEVVVRVPHPLPRGEGARGFGTVPVDGAEPHLAHLADDLVG